MTNFPTIFHEFCLNKKYVKNVPKISWDPPAFFSGFLSSRHSVEGFPTFQQMSRCPTNNIVGENSLFRHCIVKFGMGFFRFFFLFLFCPSVSKTSVTLEPLNKSKQLPKVTQGDGRPAPAILTCRTSSSPSPKLSDLTYLTCFVAFSLSLIFGKAC